jgi:hypothetical protein
MIMSKADYSWLSHDLIMILTMREGDADRWNPKAMVEFAKSFSVGALGFSVGGITAFYPTDIPHHPRSSSLGERDLVGETVKLLHDGGMRAIARIDASLATKEIFADHPEWFCKDAKGNLISVHGLYVACPNAGYYREFTVDVVKEILTRYPFDGLWANAAQFSPWHVPQCFCVNCQKKFKEQYGHEIPQENWANDVWRHYNEWRYQCIAEWCQLIHKAKEEVRPECAWLPLSQVAESWNHARPGGWDIDYTSPHVDGMVLEAQRRYTNFWWPGLEARYLHNLDPEKPANVTASYFFPWWRFYRAPTPENKIWTAQVIANGARPWLHITGYLSEHFDRRGLDAFREMFKLFKEHPEAYEDTRSQAEVALVYSRHSLDNYGKQDPEDRYLNHFRGYYNAMLDGRIPFDVLSDKRLTLEAVSRYKTLVLPNMACMTDETAEVLKAFVEQGGNLVTTFKTGFYDIWGNERQDGVLSSLTGTHYTGVTRENMLAAYGRIHYSSHPLFEDIGDTDLIPVAGAVCFVRSDKNSGPAPVTFVPPVEGEVGSGVSVPEFNQIDHVTQYPLVFEHTYGQGHVVYFPWQPDLAAYRYGFKDFFRILTNAIRMAPNWQDTVEVTCPGLLEVSLMGGKDRLVLHLINFSAPGSFNSGHRRPLEEIMPINDVQVKIKQPQVGGFTKARSVVTGRDIALTNNGDHVSFNIEHLNEFETVVLDLV